MYAYLMTAPGSIERTKIPDPVCQQDEILMSTEAVSICSTDVSYFRGHLFPDAWPIIPGHEYVGRVLEVGAKLRGAVQVGDRVCYWGQTDFGGMADFRALRPIFPGRHGMETSWYTERNFYDADQAAAVVLPDSLSSDLATIIEPLTSVLRSLLLNPPKPGDTCVVLGCGPSALLAVQVLDRYLGAGSVTVLDHNQERLDLARSYGARSAFNTRTELGALEDFVHEHHDQFADYVFDALPHIGAPRPGQKDIREIAMGLLRPGGDYVVYGATAVPQQINTWMILAKGLKLRATPFDVRLFPMTRSASVTEVALRLLETGLVDARPLLTTRVSLHDEAGVRKAFTDYGQGASMKTSMLASDLLLAPATTAIRGDEVGVGV
ncbi:zinc-dependent alcohol dehydrogenase [Streptomyces acidiscabies]|uniref:zinc-dependent alcohol dehydrogenase n=1 Tax=Streptomyces acidiscabies TaxID=42234 RepID=UPI00067C5256|nr:alcohol dehydrogenase catalytic domain-containing protein [Streptomyces acidiscabies]